MNDIVAGIARNLRGSPSNKRQPAHFLSRHASGNRPIKSALAHLAMLLFSTHAVAQNYPNRPVRIVVSFAAGGNTDLIARAIGLKLTEALGQPIVIDNRPGSGGNIGNEIAARASPDGYTLLMGAASTTINMSLYQKLPYDTLRDLAPVILCIKGANVLASNPALPVKSVLELVALAKAKPGMLNYASSGVGSANHLAGELLKFMAGIDITHIPYKGNTPALTDTAGGQVQMTFSGVPALIPYIQSGRLRAIAIGSLKRFPALPDVPTIDESGIKGYEATTWNGLMAPIKLPRDIIVRLNLEVGRILAAPELRERISDEGSEAGGGSPENFGRFMREEVAKYSKVIKAANLTAQ